MFRQKERLLLDIPTRSGHHHESVSLKSTSPSKTVRKCTLLTSNDNSHYASSDGHMTLRPRSFCIAPRPTSLLSIPSPLSYQSVLMCLPQRKIFSLPPLLDLPFPMCPSRPNFLVRRLWFLIIPLSNTIPTCADHLIPSGRKLRPEGTSAGYIFF